jgi:hypothetical protein
MRIEVIEISRTFGRQTRAYAEYRIFSGLAMFGEVVRGATVSLAPGGRDHSVTCSVLVALDAGRPVEVSARGRHAYDAINRAADRLGAALRRHARVAIPS